MMNEQEEIKGRKQDNKDRKDGAKERGEWWGKGRRRRKREREGRVPQTAMRLECKVEFNETLPTRRLTALNNTVVILPYLSGSRMLSILHHLSECSFAALALCCCDHLLLLVRGLL